MNLIKRLWNEEEGQGMIEYVLIAAFISIIAIVLVRAVGTKVNGIWNNMNGAFNSQ